ncbi:hypothetical protein [Aureimonas ureilytica]|nr:hypothetical protein [Aureimonas ureilytica]
MDGLIDSSTDQVRFSLTGSNTRKHDPAAFDIENQPYRSGVDLS